MNSADLVHTSSSLGKRKHAGIGGARDEKISSDHWGDEAGTLRKIAAGSAVQGAPARSVNGHQKSTDQVMAANSKEGSSNEPSIGSFCIQDEAAQLKSNAKSDDRLKDSSAQARPRRSNQIKSSRSGAWSENFKLLEKYKNENGHTDVPQSLWLGTWVNKVHISLALCADRAGVVQLRSLSFRTFDQQRMEKKKFDKGEKTSMNQERWVWPSFQSFIAFLTLV